MIQPCLFGDCGKKNCPTCLDKEERDQKAKLDHLTNRVRTAHDKFFERVRTGQYVSPEQKRARAKRS